MEATISPDLTVAPAALDEPRQYLTFQLNGESYAVGILNLREIIEFGQLTEVPMMPRCIRGVINLRGRVVPVVDLAARFGRQATAVSRRSSIVIFEATAARPSRDAVASDERPPREPGAGDLRQPSDGTARPAGEQSESIGILVDSVNEVIEIGRADIEPPPDFGSGIGRRFISGLARRDKGFVIVLDVQTVLTLDDLDVTAAAAMDDASTGGPA